MTTNVYGTAGETGRTLGVQLADIVVVDGEQVAQGVDLTTAQATECHMVNEATGRVAVAITGLVGDADGNVTTEFPTLVEGTFWLEWHVIEADGGVAKYPAKAADLIRFVVRQEAS